MFCFCVGRLHETFRYLGVCLTRLPVVIPFLQHNVIKEFSLKQKPQVNQPLKSRKSYSSSQENCPNSVWEAPDVLHIHSPSSQVVCRRHYVSGICYTHSVCTVHVQGHIWVFQESRSLSWIHWPGQISAVLPSQVKQTSSGGWRRTVCLCEVSAEQTHRSSFGQHRALLSPTLWQGGMLMEVCTFCLI